MVSGKRRYSAEVVGNAFAKRYYVLLKDSPEHVHKVYKDHSKIGRRGLDGIMRTYTLSDIDENLNMLSSGGFDSVEVTRVMSQDSQSGSVFVVVDGYFTLNKRLAWTFTQIFVLAPQEKGYYACNDLFTFLDITKVNESIFSTNNVIAENVPETEEVADESSRVSEPNDGLEHVSKISDASVLPIGQGQHASSTDHSPEIKTDAVDDTGNNQESHSSTECSVFVRGLPPYVTNVMIKNAFKQFGPVKRGGIEYRQPRMHFAYVEFEEANAAERAIKASHVLVDGQEVEVRKKLDRVKTVTEDAAICVSNLLPDATFALVWNAFKKFGEIIPGGCEVRHKWRISYGIVEFNEANAAQNAIEASPILIGGRKAFVVKKRRVYRSDQETYAEARK